jgi:hypothetical protein
LHKLLAKTGIFSALVNSNTPRSNAKFIKFYYEFHMPLHNKVVGLEKLHNFGIGRFGSA